MQPSNQSQTNPLGLNLDFMFGRGYLWADRERLSDWIILESLRMEIPDLSFPFDARGGLERFRDTRCLVREIELAISEVGLGDLLRQAADQLDRFEHLQVRFLDDAVHISVRVQAFGSDTYVSFRAALIPPEPARADELHLSLYDYRAYGPLPFPARLVAFELMAGLLNTPRMRPPGRGQSFTVGVAGDILSFRPLKLLLLHIFPHVGWKLPNLSGVRLDGARIRPGVVTIRASTRDDDWHTTGASVDQSSTYQLSGTRQGARALAAYEAKDLFANADQALFDGQLRQARDLLANYRDMYGLNNELVSRTLDCLLADPSASHLAEAEAICGELEANDPDDLQALLARPTLALVGGGAGSAADRFARTERVVERYDQLAETLRENGETADWILTQLAAAQHLADNQPSAAADRLREVLKSSPRNRIALEQLRDLYNRLGEQAGLEEILKRLTGVYTDRETLEDTYLRLAHHLMDREGELAEARLYLEKVLRLDPTQLDALGTLGESYVLSDEPLRALKAFGSAARAAEADDQPGRASRLLYRVARIWHDELGNTEQALLSCRRGLSMWQRDADPHSTLEHTKVLEFAATLCAQRERLEQATDYWMEVVPKLEKLAKRTPRSTTTAPDDAHREQMFGPTALGSSATDFDAVDRPSTASVQDRLIRAHEKLASLYQRRDRREAAATHLRRVIELDPDHPSAADDLASFYHHAGRPEQLLELYRDLVDRVSSSKRRVAIHQHMAELYQTLHLVDDAADQLEAAVDIDPAADDARRQLVELLRSSGQFDRLRATLDRLVDRVGDPDARWKLSVELGDVLVDELDDYQNGSQAFFEAVQIRSTDLEAMRKLADALEAWIDRDGLDQPAPAGSGTVDDLLKRVLVKLGELEPEPPHQAAAFERLAGIAERTGDQAGANEARRRADEAGRRAEVEQTEDVDRRLDALLNDTNDSEPSDFTDGAPTKVSALRPDSLTEKTDPNQRGVPPDTDQPDTDQLASGENGEQSEHLSNFRRRYHELMTDRDAGDAAAQSSPSDQDRPEHDGDDPTDPHERLKQARSTNDPPRVAEALDALLDAHDDDVPGVDLARDDYLRLSLELAELYYYDLGDSEAARPLFERVRDADPDGAGAQTTVLTTLEAIYEERGEIDNRIDILKARLNAADSQDMATTYRLLIAQLVWDERDDARAARDWLDPVLDVDPHHESAHRLLAQMARDRLDFEAAADHLRTVLEVAGDGLDAVELQRQLAHLLLDELQRPRQALDHFEQVLEAAPGDSKALDGIKSCQATLEDWGEYLSSLGHELGLLIGRPDGLSVEQMARIEPGQISASVRVPASQIVADAAQIAEQDLADEPTAHTLWGVAFSLWPEHVDALERRIPLDRRLDKWSDLAEDLESYAELLLDTDARFEALVEAADLQAERLDRPDLGRQLYAEAVAVGGDATDPPGGLDEARRSLRRLQSQDQL